MGTRDIRYIAATYQTIERNPVVTVYQSIRK